MDESHTGNLRRSRRLLFRLLASATPLLLLVAAEIAVRLSMPPVPVLQLFVREANPDIETKIGERIFEGDPLVGWKLRSDLEEVFWDYTVFSTDADGWRNDVPVRARRAGVGRVLCVGDSVTFGYRVPVAWPEHPDQYDRSQLPYPRLLEPRLSAAFGPTEVISMATPGHTSYQGRALLGRELARLDPDLVVLCFGWNDVDVRPVPDKVSLPTDTAHVLARTACCWSQALTRLAMKANEWRDESRRMEGAAPGPVTVVPRVMADDFVNNMLAMVRMAEAHGARAMIIGTLYQDRSFPEEAARMTAWRTALAATAGAAGVPYLEVTELTEAGAPGNKLLFGERIHPSAAGHQILAERVLAFIQENALYSSRQTVIPITPPAPAAVPISP